MRYKVFQHKMRSFPSLDHWSKITCKWLIMVRRTSAKANNSDLKSATSSPNLDAWRNKRLFILPMLEYEEHKASICGTDQTNTHNQSDPHQPTYVQSGVRDLTPSLISHIGGQGWCPSGIFVSDPRNLAQTPASSVFAKLYHLLLLVTLLNSQ